MRDLRQGFNELSPIKKLVFFNLYAITFVIMLIVISFILEPLFNYLFDGEANFQGLIENLTSIRFYLVKIFTGYLSAVVLLLIAPIPPKNKN